MQPIIHFIRTVNKRRLLHFSLIMFWIALFSFASCSWVEKLKREKPQPPLDSLITHDSLAQVTKSALFFKRNKTIIIRGDFLGWSMINCHFIENFAMAQTTEDWAFRDLDSACIYVTGGHPNGLNPFDLHDRGTDIVLKARVKTQKRHRLYLEYIDALILGRDTEEEEE